MRYEIGQANRLGNRNNNQDRFAAIETVEGVLLVLADGMGGRPGGEVAAQTLIDTARELYLDSSRPVSRPTALLERILLESHRLVVENSKRYERPPGSTGVLCLIQRGLAHWAHVGDSRLYLYRNGLPIIRTTDHSYVEHLYRRGEITSIERETHPKRNQITQCIGYQDIPPTVEHGKALSLELGDVLLLCSDGLWGALDDAQMGLQLENNKRLDDALAKMSEQAEINSYPKSDNISVIALRMGHNENPRYSSGKSAGTEQVDPLLDAIEHIEQAYKQYQQEMDDKPEES